MKAYSSLLLLACIAGALGCSDSSSNPSSDAGADATLDANTADATPGLDAATDMPGVDAGLTDAGATDGFATDVSVVDSAVPDAETPDAMVSVDAGASCDEQVTALAELLNIGGRACSVTVRLAYETRAVLGYQVTCGRFATLSESEARARAESDTTFGEGATLISGSTPADEFVFYEAAGDFGGSSAVSVATGLTVFGGATVWDGRGEINTPTTWRSATEIGAGCDASGGLATLRGWDLRSGEALSETDINAAASVVAGTAVPAALWRGGYVFSSIVLLYPRTVGAFDPASAEWIVVVNGGWLE